MAETFVSIGEIPLEVDSSPTTLGVNEFGEARLFQLGTASTRNIGTADNEVPTNLAIANDYQEKLVNGTNIKTVNGFSLLGNGNVTISDTVGTVTSVGLTAPTGFSVVGSPITESGDIQLKFASGYSLTTATEKTLWNSAIQPTGSTITSVNIGSANITNAEISNLTRTVASHFVSGEELETSTTREVVGADGGIQVFSLDIDTTFTWNISSGTRITMIIRNNVVAVDFGDLVWMTAVPTLNEEHIIEILSVNGVLYAWDKGGRILPPPPEPEPDPV